MRRTRELPSSTDTTFNNNQTKKPQSQFILNLASLKPRAFHSRKELSKASLNLTFLWALNESAKGISFEKVLQNWSCFPYRFLKTHKSLLSTETFNEKSDFLLLPFLLLQRIKRKIMRICLFKSHFRRIIFIPKMKVSASAHKRTGIEGTFSYKLIVMTSS